MFHAQIELDYTFDSFIKKLDALKLSEVRTQLPDCGIPEYPVPADWRLDWDRKTFLADLDMMQALSELGIEYSVKRFKGQMKQSSMSGVSNNIHISLPGVGLLMIDEVELLSDCCTYNLASYLKDGWRIIAVCPPVDARRPDYIMGRSSYAKVER